ncbi:MAG: hypothetical protein EPN88_16135 [Bacteroidetes bacterium]|nr:MAG: hypothetical protein EPN88_16135 [Bacteroidota bacterium]
MMIKVKPAILLLIYFLFLQSAYGQVQENMTDYLKQRFLTYSGAVHREEIFIHSDREEYIAGEDMWFNLYLIDRQSNKPSVADKIAYFELLNPENQPVIQKRILIDKGFGAGQILLPDSLSSGTYTIRAYTNWMKNFLPYNCFIKDIKIFNVLSKKAFREKIYSENKIVKGKITDNVPVGLNAGLTLGVNNFKPDTLEIIVNTDNNYRSGNRNILYLFIHTHGLINYLSTERVLTDITRIDIPKNELVPGINHITVFDSKGLPLCERFIYTPDKNKQSLIVNSSDSYKTREKVTLDLAFGKILDPPLDATNFSISVSPVTNKSEKMELSDYMVFGSEFGLMPQHVINGRNINELPPDELDCLLLTAKSNWIEWDKILSDNLPVLKYQVENRDHYLTGKVMTVDLKAPDTEEYLLLSSPGKAAVFQYATTDRQGIFSFRIHIDESVNDLIIQPDDVTKKLRINIESSFSDKYLQSQVSPDSAYKPVPSYISKWSVNYQVNKIYEYSFVANRVISKIQPIKPKRFYGKPDIELVMTDYIQLPVMQEVFFELLPGVSLKSRKSAYELSIADPVTKTSYGVPPGMLIDGVFISDPTIIGNLDPEIVERIDVVKEKYLVGNYGFYGIVNIITRTGDYSSVTLPDYAIRMPYRVLDPVWSFASPDYSAAGSGESHIPDFRNTLYWNPSVKPDVNGKARVEFWTSDILADYEIIIQGITPDGKMISSKKIIRVE